VLNEYRQLRYFANEKCKKWLGTIAIDEVEKIQNATDKSFSFHLFTAERTWVLCAESLQERKQWLRAIETSKGRQIHISTFCLMGSLDDTPDPEVKEHMLIDEDPSQPADSLKSSLSTESVKSKPEEVDAESMEMDVVWKCTSCHQTYASMWPKCPGCLKNDTHRKTCT